MSSKMLIVLRHSHLFDPALWHAVSLQPGKSLTVRQNLMLRLPIPQHTHDNNDYLRMGRAGLK